MSKAKQENYDLFLKMFMKETGKDEQVVRQLMSKLKRAEGQLNRIYTEYCNTGSINKTREIDLRAHVISLMGIYYKTVLVSFNEDPRGGAIRFIFTKTGWINTLGSDVCVNW
jgi:hypothetical protein